MKNRVAQKELWIETRRDALTRRQPERSVFAGVEMWIQEHPRSTFVAAVVTGFVIGLLTKERK